MSETIRVARRFAVSPEDLYNAWLDSEEHSAFTGGGAAEIEPRVGGRHSAWDGYIEGEILELEPGRRIVKTWRASDFPDGAGPSRVELIMEPVEGGTELLLIQTDLPEGEVDRFIDGWEEFYFKPMHDYFGGIDDGDATLTDAADQAEETRAAEVAEKKRIPKPRATAKPPAAREPTAKPRAKQAAATKKPAARAKAAKGPAKAKAAAKKPAKRPAKAKAAAARKSAAKGRQAARAKKPAAKKPPTRKAAARKPVRARKPAARPKKRVPAKRR